MRASRFRFLLWQFFACSDSGKYDDTTVGEIYSRARTETLSTIILDRFGRDLDVSTIDESDWATLNVEWSNMANAIDAARKFGVSKRGINLLMAYALQSMQDRRPPRRRLIPMDHVRTVKTWAEFEATICQIIDYHAPLDGYASFVPRSCRC